MSNEQVKMICSQRCVGACHEYTADTASPGGTIAHGRRKSRMRIQYYVSEDYGLSHLRGLHDPIIPENN